jgi:iron complex transport system ATP-binding protein
VTPGGPPPRGAADPPAGLSPAGLSPVPAGLVADATARAGTTNALLGFGTADPDGLPADLLCGSSGDSSAAARALVDAVGGLLGTPERRVAASMVVLGYAARLVGPAVAVLLRDGIVLDLRPERIRYSYRADRGFRLTAPEPAGWAGPAGQLADQWCRHIVDGHLRGLVAAVRADTPVAAGLLWGNIASGLVGAVRTVTQHAGPDGGSGSAESNAALAGRLLGYGPLAGSGDLTVHGGRVNFVRRSCCLYYRLDGGGMCADCALLTS